MTLEILLQPFTYDYMLRAIYICSLTGGVCGLISCFLIFKNWSLIGDALSHAVVPGVVSAYIFNLPLIAGAFFSGLFAIAGMALLKGQSKLREDVSMGVIYSGFFAIGLLLISLYPALVNLQSIILGNVLAISDFDLAQVSILCLLSFLFITLKWRDLMVLFFDAPHANSIGLRPMPLKIIFFITLSATIIAALQAVGACLIIAMLVIPASCAYMLTDSFAKMLVLSSLIGALSAAFGTYCSFFFNAATGGMIVCLQGFLFLCCMIFSPKYGVLSRNWNDR